MALDSSIPMTSRSSPGIMAASFLRVSVVVPCDPGISFPFDGQGTTCKQLYYLPYTTILTFELQVLIVNVFAD